MKNYAAAFIPAVIALSAGFGAAAASEAVVGTDSTIELSAEGLKLVPMAYAGWWSRHAQAEYDASRKNGFVLSFDENDKIEGALEVSAAADGGVRAEYKFLSHTEIQPDVVAITMEMPRTRLRNATWKADGKSGEFPAEMPESPHLFAGKVSTLTLDGGAQSSLKLSFKFDSPTSVLLQDNRRWGGNSDVLRIQLEHPNPLTRGVEFSVAFTLTGASAFEILRDAPVKLFADGKNWIPVKHEYDVEPGSALDFSSVIPWHAPAGKFGWVQAKGEAFVFEKMSDTPQRFYGNNLCFSANYVSKEEAAELAARFRRLGYNTVRIHHHDDTLVEGGRASTQLNAARVDQFDFLIAEFIKNGIYVTTDLFVSRQVPWRNIGVDKDGMIPMDDFKLLCAVNSGAMADWKKFSRAFLEHTNPYTGRTYAEEPALAWLSLINEGNLGNHVGRHKNLPEYVEKWQAWLAARKTAEPEKYAAIPDSIPPNAWDKSAHIAAYMQFLSEIEGAMIAEMKTFLRDELRCKALITNDNGWTHKISDFFARQEHFDYVDDHFYVDHPQFIEKDWQLPSRCPNENPFKNSALGMRACAFVRIAGKPFTVSEFNFSGPGRYRGVGGMATGAAAALQDWSALWRFAYSHSREHMFRPATMGYFNTGSDPVMSASERASLCLFLRGDIAPLSSRIDIVIRPEDAAKVTSEGMPSMTPSWIDAAWKAKVALTGADTHGGKSEPATRLPAATAYSTAGAAVVRDIVKDLPVGGDAVAVNPETGAFIIDTPRTAGGFAESGEIKTANFSTKLSGSPASVWASSLDGKPLSESSRILVAHVTDVQNTGISYAERARRTLLAWGSLPHIAEAGKAEIALTTTQPLPAVWRLANDGKRLAKVPTQLIGSTLAFTADTAADPEAATLYYEIVRE